MLFNSISQFFTSLKPPAGLPAGVSIMNPYESDEVKKYVETYYSKFYSDNKKRIFVVGINPGRFGAGVTGIAFTDPVNLEDICGIKNHFDKKSELSSRFIYKLIDYYGGTKSFFDKFFLTALYPLALTRDGKNYNYYDSKEIWEALKQEILISFEKQLSHGARKEIAVCLGKKNEKYLKEINRELNYFEKIVTLDHPRYIMQYRSKKLDEYLQLYNNTLNLYS